jgi:hypothetical protein
MDDYTAQIFGDGGNWTETEILGNMAIVKVRASTTILQSLNAVFKRLPKDALSTSLADLSNAQKTALRNEILDQGYSLTELQARFGNDLGQYTLRDVLRFMASRRRKPRYDAETDTIILDGPDQPCRDIDNVDAGV